MKEEKDHIIILDKTKRKQLKIPKMQTHMQKLRKRQKPQTPPATPKTKTDPTSNLKHLPMISCTLAVATQFSCWKQLN